MKLANIIVANELPASLLDVEHIDRSSRVSITVGGVVNGPATQLDGVWHREVVVVACIEHTIGKR